MAAATSVGRVFVCSAFLCAAILVASLGVAFAGPVPGDPVVEQTTGQVFAGYAFTANTTTYSNITLDVRDISDAVTDCASAAFSRAWTIWVNGTNSYRNRNSGTFRIPQAVMSNTFTAEDWYTQATAYYSTEGKRYITKYIDEALAGTDTFQGACPGVRAEVIKAGLLFYPLLYFYHEVDAAVKGMRTITLATAPKEAVGQLYAGVVEAQDGWACYYGPDAVYATREPLQAATSTTSASRVGGKFNAWQVQEQLHQFFTCSNSHKVKSPINQDMLILAKRSTNIIYRALAQNPAINAVEVAPIVTQYRLAQQQLLNIHQVQLTLKAVHDACQKAPLRVNNCAGTCSRPKQLWAAAWMHWRMAELTFSNTAIRMPAIARDRLEEVRSKLSPFNLADDFKPSKADCKGILDDVERISNDFGYPQWYNWRSVVGNCRKFW